MTAPVPNLELEWTSDIRRMPDLRLQMRQWAEARGWTEPQVGELVLALDEAVSNIIRHGYDGQPQHKILIKAQGIHDVAKGEGVEIHVRDFGKQTDPAEIRGRDLQDVRPGGLGVHIMRAMVNQVEYQRASGGGMLVVLRKFRSHTASVRGRLAKRG
jgi:serine/threonine-protein kinase RsbW